MFGQTDAHTDTRIIFIFANVVFLRVSYMTYCHETRDTKNAMRERVKSESNTDHISVRLEVGPD
jgi:hypothetical protein